MVSRDEIPLGTFEEQVMLAVLRTSGEAFGMAVRREIELVTGRDVAVGAVYATLDRLEAKRLVVSKRGRRAACRGDCSPSRAPARRRWRVSRDARRSLARRRPAAAVGVVELATTHGDVLSPVRP